MQPDWITSVLDPTASPFISGGTHSSLDPTSTRNGHIFSCSVVPTTSPHSPAHLPSPGHHQNPSFSGDNRETCETVLEWHEQFEAVATIAGWDDHYKFLHLTTRLRGKAHSFYHSCTPTQRSDYQVLCSELKKCFTPGTSLLCRLSCSTRGNKCPKSQCKESTVA